MKGSTSSTARHEAKSEVAPNADQAVPSKRRSRRTESGMNKGESLWRVFFALTVPIFIYMFHALVQFHTEMDKRDMPYYKFSDLKFIVCTACGFYFVKNIWERVMFPIITPFISESHSGEERINRTKRVVKWIFDFFYYGVFTAFGYYHFYEFLPQIMGGNAYCRDNFRVYPYYQDTKWVQEYYLLQLGNLFFRTVDQSIRKRNDVKFWEYFLHHFLALVMVLHSYTSHWTRAGTVVLLSHDFTDIWLASVRAQEALKYKIPYFFPIYFALTVAVWFYIRGIMFPACIMTHMWELYFLDSYPPRARICDLFFAIMTVFLCVMNFYWIYALSKVGLKSLFTRSYANVYDPVLLKNKKRTDSDKIENEEGSSGHGKRKAEQTTSKTR